MSHWECPYCGNEVSEDTAHFSGCCGEMHCVEVSEPPAELRAEYERQRSSMEPNPNGHGYGCGCEQCMYFYRSLK